MAGGLRSKRAVYCISTNTTTPLGLSTDEVWNAIARGESGVCLLEAMGRHSRQLWASQMPDEQWDRIRSRTADRGLSPLEEMGVHSLRDALSGCDHPPDLSKTLLIFTSTKGNIEWLGKEPDHRNRLSTSAGIIARAIGLESTPIVISHACVSGVSGLVYALRSLQSGRYETAIIVGADRLSHFVLSGFGSFMALDGERCKPFDAARKGINLGEAAATIILSVHPGAAPLAQLAAGATSNDANHISGPSRTGEELALAINASLREAALTSSEIDAISAHGTATVYNDEMESRAFALSDLLGPPVHSLKAYLGHTLGAAGVLESALLIQSILRGQTIASRGYEDHGVSQPINVLNKSIPLDIKNALKTASGFGGCNAVAVWKKV